MADKITLDFENNIIEFDTENQKGTEYCEDLKEMKEEVLKLLGYETVDVTPAINAINQYLNGEIEEEELRKKMDEF